MASHRARPLASVAARARRYPLNGDLPPGVGPLLILAGFVVAAAIIIAVRWWR